MRDRDIVAAIIAGDPAGLALAYNSYAAGLYGYCRSLLAGQADAAGAVQDAFVIAAAEAARLQSPAKFRTWLYAVARNECYRRLRAESRQAGLDEAIGMADDDTDPGLPARRGELHDLMAAAIGGLNFGDRELIELCLRHDLAGSDLAAILGVPVSEAHALVSRARSQLEQALGSWPAARTGRRDCTELDAILDRWDAKLAALWRKPVSRHMEECDVCADRKRDMLSPVALLSVLPLARLPGGLRGHVLRLACDGRPEAAGYRDRVVSRAGPFTETGFPVQVAPAGAAGHSARPGRPARGGGSGAGGAGSGGRRHAPEHSATVLAAAAALVLVLGSGMTAHAWLAGSGHASAHHHAVAGAISRAGSSAGPLVSAPAEAGALPPAAPGLQPGTVPAPLPAAAWPDQPGHSRRPAKSPPPGQSSASASPAPPGTFSPPPQPAPLAPSSAASPPSLASDPAGDGGQQSLLAAVLAVLAGLL